MKNSIGHERTVLNRDATVARFPHRGISGGAGVPFDIAGRKISVERSGGGDRVLRRGEDRLDVLLGDLVQGEVRGVQAVADDAGAGHAERRAHPEAEAPTERLAKPVPGALYPWLRRASWLELGLFSALLFFWIAPGFAGETTVFGWAHGVGYLMLLFAIFAGVLRHEVPFWLLAAFHGLRNVPYSGVSVHLVPMLVWKGLDESTAAFFVGLAFLVPGAPTSGTDLILNGLLYLGIGVVLGIAGIGLMRLRPWAWGLALLASLVTLVYLGYNMYQDSRSGAGVTLTGVFTLLIVAAVFVYLLSVARAFRRPQTM